MGVILASGLTQLILALLGIGCLVWIGFQLFSETKVVAVAPGVLFLLFLWGFLWGINHAVVRPNEVMLVIDRSSGQPIGDVRPAGVTEVPAFTSVTYTFPAQTIYQWCPTFTPSSKGGAGLETVVCFTADASKIDWIKQFRAFNGNADVVTAGWQNAIQQTVAAAISNYVPRELTDSRVKVETDIFNATTGWFSSNGIPVSMAGLKEWHFKDPNAQAAYDQALLSQTKIDVASAEQQAALIKAETQVLIASKQHQACVSAGMVSEYACLQYLWLTSGVNPSSVFLNVGQGNPSIAVPPAFNDTPAPVSTPGP